MSTQDGTPLSTISGWAGTYAQALARSWITTAEQVLGVASTPGGIGSLARELGVSEETMGALIGEARAALPPSVAARLTRPAEVTRHGLGALPPEQNPAPHRRRNSVD